MLCPAQCDTSKDESKDPGIALIKRGRIDRIVVPNGCKIWQQQQQSCNSKPSEVCAAIFEFGRVI